MNSPASLAPDLESSSADALETLSAVYKASGDPLRLEILRVLRRETFGVLELCQLFDAKQSGMSHHLKVLSRAGLVESQREGNAIFYRRPLRHLPESADEQAADGIFRTLDLYPLSTDRQRRIAAIREQRSAQSQAFFARYAERFREQQELIADFGQYADPVEELIDARFGGARRKRAMEIGPGEGHFLPVLAERFEEVVGVDNSREMLALAAETAHHKGLMNVILRQGEAGAIASSGLQDSVGRFDLVVANMVLHHLPNPADLFPDVAALLAPEGRFIISDLSSHDQNWVRENCGDLWLGFGAAELTTWARAAGLTATEPAFIGLRNGFQIQIWDFSPARH
ncbi:MAG: ArsR family transcriptional regulator [Alteromonadaceae bacterium]|nr:ArsR family transcriptional regulator [Alteromonadaceae bacterium]|tara:strand:- start:591 stop:1616 length:1026 start_codon:yes stop_codon:yes gene_type:complete